MGQNFLQIKFIITFTKNNKKFLVILSETGYRKTSI